MRADHAVGLALGQYLDRLIAHAAGHDAVTRRWCAAALDMTEDRHARVEPKFLMDPLADLDCAACTLGDDDHIVCLAAQASRACRMRSITSLSKLTGFSGTRTAVAPVARPT